MNVFKIIVILAVSTAGYHYWTGHRSGTASTPGAFVALPPADGQTPDAVYVVAAQNCPHAAAQRADRLAEALAGKGIPVVRTSNVMFPATRDRAVYDQMSSVMTGPPPIVFVRGRAKSNPNLDEVVTEFEGNRALPSR